MLFHDNTVIISKGGIQNTFNKYYDKLMSYYLLITDSGSARAKEAEMSVINKRDRKHMDQIISLMGRLRTKKTSIFYRGLFASRHNVSCRTVLGGAIDGEIRKVNIPHHIANKLSSYYKVYNQNLDAMKQLVMAMADPEVYKDVTIPKVFGIWNNTNGYFTKVNMKNAMSRAALLKAGDKISITLLNDDWVLQVRFPALREESWSAYQVKKDFNSIITIPPSTCEMKGADFDGDEAQVYVSNSRITDIETLLLQSILRQMITYKDGRFAVWYSADAPDGLKQIKRGLKTKIYNYEHVHPPMDVIEIVESYLPKDLSYKDKNINIKNGKIIGEKINLINHELHKYMYYLYGAEFVENFMTKCVNLAYDLNRNRGNTLGFEISINKPETRTQIEKIKNETYEELKRIEQNKSPHKFIMEKNLTEKQKAVIGEILLEDLKDTNLGKLGYTDTRLDEIYNMIVLMDYTMHEGDRIQPVLAENTRMTCAHPRFSLDPISRGYNHKSYANDITALSHFYDCIPSRRTFFQKGVGTGVQGYMGKRLGIAYGTSWVNHIGQVVDGFRLISTQYGSCGIDSRRSVVQTLVDINLEEKDFNEKYSQDEKLIKLRKKMREYEHIYNQLTNFTMTKKITNNFITGFHFDQYIDSLVN